MAVPSAKRAKYQPTAAQRGSRTSISRTGPSRCLNRCGKNGRTGFIPSRERHYRDVTQPYVPLRVFSSFTMLEGAMEPKTIAERAAKLGFPATALTDRNGLYGVMPFSDACMANGVQPIIGTILGLARPPEVGGEARLDWLVLLAKDEQGYANLCKLVSAAHLDRPVEEEPHVPFARLDGLSEGLIALTAGAEGAVV